MKRNIKILFLLLSMGVISVCVGQNTTIVFYYDESGNRIERSLGFRKIEENGQMLADEEKKSWQSAADDYFEGTMMSLYPNPTNGQFYLAFSEKPSSIIKAELCTIKGDVLETRHVESITEEFDLNDKPSGIYLLRLTTIGNSQTWKIIKKN